MAAKTNGAQRRTPLMFLFIWLTVCVLLIVINVSAALHQSELNGDHVLRDVYTVEVEVP